jgi:RNA polymerase sigma-70 factor, ECF subfamily
MDSLRGSRMQNRSSYRELTDDELVSLCQHGNQAAFDELMRRHQMSAMKVAISIVRDRQDAEDEVQNAFWKAYQHIN